MKTKIISYTNSVIPPSPFLYPTTLPLATPPCFQGVWCKRFDFGSSRLHSVRCGIVSWRSRRMPIASLPPAVHFINCNQHTASAHLSCLLAGTAGDVTRPLKRWTKCHSSQISVSASEWARSLCSTHPPFAHKPHRLVSFSTFEFHCLGFFHIALNFYSHTDSWFTCYYCMLIQEAENQKEHPFVRGRNKWLLHDQIFIVFIVWHSK